MKDDIHIAGKILLIVPREDIETQAMLIYSGFKNELNLCLQKYIIMPFSDTESSIGGGIGFLGNTHTDNIKLLESYLTVLQQGGVIKTYKLFQATSLQEIEKIVTKDLLHMVDTLHQEVYVN